MLTQNRGIRDSASNNTVKYHNCFFWDFNNADVNGFTLVHITFILTGAGGTQVTYRYHQFIVQQLVARFMGRLWPPSTSMDNFNPYTGRFHNVFSLKK